MMILYFIYYINNTNLKKNSIALVARISSENWGIRWIAESTKFQMLNELFKVISVANKFRVAFDFLIRHDE